MKVYQPIQLRYAWRYLFLVVDGRAGALSWCWLEALSGEEVLAAVGGLRRTGAADALVWDGASAHRDADVLALGLPLITLPAYSPELNPAERIFQELRRAVEGRLYATLHDKVAAVEAELTKLEADPDRVRSLAGWDWITAAVTRQPADLAA